MIYIVEDILELDIEEALRAVSGERRALALRYRFDIDRRQSLAVYLLLRYGLKMEYGIHSLPRLGLHPEGKPYLINHSDIHFNVSHCRKGVACAISREPIGVDIEEITPIDWDVAKRVMNDAQLDDIVSAHNPEEHFCTLWTMKESLLKQTGEGLCDNLPLLAIDNYTFTHHIGSHYVCTACYSSAEQHEQFSIVGATELLS